MNYISLPIKLLFFLVSIVFLGILSTSLALFMNSQDQSAFQITNWGPVSDATLSGFALPTYFSQHNLFFIFISVLLLCISFLALMIYLFSKNFKNLNIFFHNINKNQKINLSIRIKSKHTHSSTKLPAKINDSLSIWRNSIININHCSHKLDQEIKKLITYQKNQEQKKYDFSQKLKAIENKIIKVGALQKDYFFELERYESLIHRQSELLRLSDMANGELSNESTVLSAELNPHIQSMVVKCKLENLNLKNLTKQHQKLINDLVLKKENIKQELNAAYQEIIETTKNNLKEDNELNKSIIFLTSTKNNLNNLSNNYIL
ncbi:MAG: hypothetical protein KC505_08045 [Myxococcales bacterium]|nr:hypothetical protein [Myxococcales bacterium]